MYTDVHEECGATNNAAMRRLSLGVIRFQLNATVHWAQRLAAMGTSLRHSVHGLVVAAGAGWLRRDLAASRFIGSTTMKYTPAAISTNDTTAFRNEP